MAISILSRKPQDRYTTQVVVDIDGAMLMLDSRGGEGGFVPAQSAQQSAPAQPASARPAAQPTSTMVNNDISFR